MPWDYDDFDLEIGREGEGYISRVSVAGMGDARNPLSSPFTAGELEKLLAGAGVVRRDVAPAGEERKTIQEIGRCLFAAVFGGKVGGFWDASLQRARESDRGLRLHLRLRSPELWDWPWEYLYDPDSDFLALLPDVSIVRYPEIPQPVRRLRVHPPLRVLVAAARPRKCPPLGTEREWEAVKAAWESIASPGRVELELLEGASTAKVRRALRRPFHIFHFIGHGKLDTAHHRGVLLFEKGTGEQDFVTGRELIRILRRQPALRLVVLNACEGARGAREDPFSGVAQQLVHGQIPAVVAMQFRIADDAAISFSRRFYQSLAEGMPVDAAVSEGRLELATERFEVEWGNPVLYMRAQDGQIFVLPSSAREASSTDVERAPRAGPVRRWVLAGVARRWGVRAVAAALALAVGTVALSVGYRSLADWISRVPETDCPSPPGLSMAFAKIEPGIFTMGTDQSGDEAAHQVTITKPFCIGRFEVTQGQWKKVMGGLPQLKFSGSDLPVGNVSWHDAQAFIAVLNLLDAKAHYRLPTEAQWEYAAHAGTEGRFSFGDDPRDLVKYGNCKPRGVSDGYEGLAPVGSFHRNPWGLYDMYGNVSEWVEDWRAPYPSGAATTDPTGPLTGEVKVRRGGSLNYTYYCDSTYRSSSKPETRNEAFGFRLVRDPVDRAPRQFGS
jgi:formylglycine-generating enzyme required for sulfatase activity